MRIYRLLFLTLLTAVLSCAATLSFEPNHGQTNGSVRYVARTPGGVVLLTDSEIVLRGPSNAVHFSLIGSDTNAPWQASDATAATTSYYIGRDPDKYVKDIPHYERLTRHNIYPGIDA